MQIGELSARAAVSKDTIRYYEKLGLLRAASQNPWNRYKRFGPASLTRLAHIKALQAIGFSLAEIHALLVRDAGQHPCAELPATLAEKITRIDEQVSALLAVKALLQSVAKSCDTRCEDRDGLPGCFPASTGSRCC